MDQVHDLQNILGAIIAKLPTTWNNYKKNSFTLLRSYPWISYRSTCELKKKQGRNKRKKPLDGNHNNHQGNKNAKTNDKDTRPKCHYCHKPRHFKRDCRFLKKKQQETGNQANMANNQVSEIVAMV
ncbi:hypothetical protein V2J09_022999 [Rumex salicifolius]